MSLEKYPEPICSHLAKLCVKFPGILTPSSLPYIHRFPWAFTPQGHFYWAAVAQIENDLKKDKYGLYEIPIG